MKITGLLLVAIFLANVVHAATYYVNANNTVPVPPYTSWATAATNIQDAISMTTNGDMVLVTNGVYAFGGQAVTGTLTNRVALTNAITVQSVNGPLVTTILGAGPIGNSAIRCAWLTNGASLAGFTLMKGATQYSGNGNTLQSGGGVWCASTNAFIRNCVIASNQASIYGGGIYQGTISDSLIWTNTDNTGAASYSVLNNCTVVSNNTSGVYSPAAMTNCIIYFNNSGNYSVSGSAFSHCCTTPALAGTGNFTNAPAFYTDSLHLANSSPCIGAGVNIAGAGTDIFGNAWANPPSVGCAEWIQAPLVGGVPKITLTGDPVGFTVSGLVYNGASPNFYWLENSTPLTNNGHFSGTQTTNLTATGVSFTDAGNYQLMVSNLFGVATSSVATLVVHCVNAAGNNPVAPYSTWATAATNIQDAITSAQTNDVVLVTNGLYATGGISMDGVITNRVSVNKPILVQSVNGASATMIQGAWDPVSTNGPGAIRGLWMTNGVIVSGFTIGKGATRTNSVTSKISYTFGGGVFGSSTNSMVCNCIIATNAAAVSGGGAYMATMIGCRLTGNHVFAVVGSSSMNGGGAERCNLNGCVVAGNSADSGSGGGADNCNLVNCALVGNAASNNGGGANSGTLVNCTVTTNNSSVNNSGSGGAVYGASLTNCIVIGNYSKTSNTNYASSTLVYCCADPLPSGVSNVDVNPQFAADGYHLIQTSPCIGIGNSNVVTGTDIDGQAWNNPPSIGCDEWYPQPVIGVQPSFRAGVPPHGLTCTVTVAGEGPFTYFWSKNGSPITDDGHHSNSGTTSMLVNQFAPDDSGAYQVVITNAYGSVTSALVTVTIHGVNATGSNPVPPYTSWATAATNIQDAINVAAPGEIVLVTNGVYSGGGMAMAGGLTNRVAINKVITVMSANGWQGTIIQGAWDPITTNGPGAVRCAWLTNGAVLNGFTLENGATLATGDSGVGGPLQSGGGVWCPYTNSLVLNCVLTNNSASMGGGGASYGTIANSLIIGNMAPLGGGVVYSTLENCTVTYNIGYDTYDGAGTRFALVQNCIVLDNYDLPLEQIDNYDSPSSYYYSCSYNYPRVPLAGPGDINASDAEFIDVYHISTISPCYGTGNSAYASGYDLDGQPWNNPPSMGCSEIVTSNLVGPLSISVNSFWTLIFTNQFYPYFAAITGRAANVVWTFGDGPVYTNYANSGAHTWTNSGDYFVTATAYNNDNPGGVSGSLLVHVQQLMAPQILPPVMLTNGLQIQFTAQTNAMYTVQYTTNLTSGSWQSMPPIFLNQQATIQVLDPGITNSARFYRIYAQP